jgi:hypothetical protein
MTEMDPRWQKLQSMTFRCSTCDEVHEGLFDIACSGPEQWGGGDEQAANGAAADATHILSEDFCIIEGRDFFVRAVLPIPIIGTDQTMAYGVWSTLSKKNFDHYMETFDDGEQGELGPWFGWLSNRLNGYPDTLNLKCQVHPENDRQRPWLELESTDHPLAIEQRDGITIDRLLEIYALNGHDFRAALTPR